MNAIAHEVPAQVHQNSTSKVKLIVLGIVALSTLAAVGVGGRWLIYRRGHVVVDDAEVKGTITKLGARIDGQVKDILVKPGQRVTKGQVLIQLEDQHLQAALQVAEAELEAATNELRSESMAVQAESLRVPVEIERSRSMLASAVAVLEGSQSESVRLGNEFDRASALYKQGMVSASELDVATAARGKAQADVQSARGLKEAAQGSVEASRLELDALQARQAHLGSLQARIAVARARIAAAQADLIACVLRAPDDGWVVERIVELGGSAKVGEPMLSLWIGRPWVEAWASEKALGQMQIGSKARVSLDAFPGRPLSARVEGFGMLTDKELLTRPVPTTLDSLIHRGALVRVCLQLENDEPLRLQPGLSAVVGIEKASSAKFRNEQVVKNRNQEEPHVLASTRGPRN